MQRSTFWMFIKHIIDENKIMINELELFIMTLKTFDFKQMRQRYYWFKDDRKFFNIESSRSCFWNVSRDYKIFLSLSISLLYIVVCFKITIAHCALISCNSQNSIKMFVITIKWFRTTVYRFRIDEKHKNLFFCHDKERILVNFRTLHILIDKSFPRKKDKQKKTNHAYRKRQIMHKKKDKQWCIAEVH